MVEPDDSPRGQYRAFWAHDRVEEKQALIDFLDYVHARRESNPGMHIYHYASYEVSALKRLVVRHQHGETFLDQLLAEGVFVDLYSVVRQSIRVSQPSYSLKKLEPLYMGDDLRDDEDGVTTAAGSIIEYHEFVDARRRGDEDAAASKLAHIADYNHYDCTSTWRLRDWIRSIVPAMESTESVDEVAPRGGREVIGG